MLEATQAFSKAEVKKLCTTYNNNLEEALVKLQDYFNTMSSNDSWWHKLLHDRKTEKEIVCRAVSVWMHKSNSLYCFANADTGTQVPSPIILSNDTYKEITRTVSEIVTDALKKTRVANVASYQAYLMGNRHD